MAESRPPESVKRRYPRITLGAQVHYISEHLSITEETRDISLGGIFINTGFLDPVGTAAVLRIHLPEQDELLVTPGVVRWTTLDREETSEVLGAGMGLEFVDGLAALRAGLVRRAGVEVLPEDEVLLAQLKPPGEPPRGHSR